jgi:radical SAM protein with 4Fe4S-binding SPASM domain
MKLPLAKPQEVLEVIVKLAGESCNINCHYCFEKRKPYDRATILSNETLARFLSLATPRPIDVQFHGGEPMLVGMERMGAYFDILRSYPVPIRVRMQTNGTLLSREWLDFFRSSWPGFELGISVDGDDEGNRYRVDYKEKPVFASIEGALELLSSEGWRVGAACVVHRGLLGRARQTLDFFRRYPCIRSVSLLPCLDYKVFVHRTFKEKRALQMIDQRVERPDWSTSPSEYMDFLEDVFGIWRADALYERFTMEPYTSVIRRLAGKSPSLCHFSEQKCGHSVTLYPDGRVGSCDELRGEDSQLGTVNGVERLDELLQYETNPALLASLNVLLEKCEGCSYRTTCGGGCLATRRQYHGTAYDEEYCGYRQRLVDMVAGAVNGALPPHDPERMWAKADPG